MPFQEFKLSDYGSSSENEKKGINRAQVVAVVAKNGDLATTQRVEAIRQRCADAVLKSPTSIRPVWNDAAVTGPRVNMSKLLSGQPRPFGRFERVVTRKPKVLTVYVPMGGLAYRSEEEIACSSVAGIVVVDLLESAGYRCEVWGASCAGDYGSGCGPQQIRTLLKEASDPADINAISRIAHVAIFRGLVLSLRHDKGASRTEDIDPLRFDDSRKCVTIKHSYSEEDAVTEARRVLAEFE